MRERPEAGRRSLALPAVALSAALVLPALGAEPIDGALGGAQALLRQAFARRYECDTRQRITLNLRAHGREVQRQRIEVATKIVDGRLRALARFTHPPDLRDTALLVLEQEGRPDDYFLFLPALNRVRRVSGAQRSDSFMGTDLSYEDLERRRIEDFRDFALADGAGWDEPVRVVSARPRRALGYDRVEFAIAERDAALLETRYFKAAVKEPIKSIRFPRGALREQDGVSVPTRILVRNFRTGTETEAVVEALEINPVLDDRLFTTNALEREVAPGMGE